MILRSKLTAVAALLTVGIFSTHVQASILTFSDLSGSGINAGIVTLGTSYFHTYAYLELDNHDYQTLVSNYSVVTLAPTNKTSGLALDYTKTTTSYIQTRTDYSKDYASLDLSSAGSTIGPGKALMITGKIISTVDTNFSFEMQAHGKYSSTAIPGVGDIPNGSVAFFTGPDATSLIAPYSSSTTYYPNFGYFDISSSNSFQLTAGVAATFAVLVYSTSASLEELYISGYSDAYGIAFHDTPHSSSYNTLVGSHLLSPTPEPETWAMMFAGLLGVGFVARRRQS